MNRHDRRDGEERPRWHDPDDDEGPPEWEVEPEEEKEDGHPVLDGTAPIARMVFLCIVALVLLGGAVALIKGVGAGFFR
jgi:hypothetical protein